MPDEYYDNEPRVTSTSTDNLWTHADDESIRCKRCKKGKLRARMTEYPSGEVVRNWVCPVCGNRVTD